ncbi:hypothetical protein OIU74_014700 [Salix koriyanagi]|uniref:Uncharacterized protein n=1 Tax=Salix koriyanagi TaxID=2511006 RepID=A0A9Q0PWD2_9ROSI|nr:hypothetical protein OIU74_014700 [Salix koriyanagi]
MRGPTGITKLAVEPVQPLVPVPVRGLHLGLSCKTTFLAFGGKESRTSSYASQGQLESILAFDEIHGLCISPVVFVPQKIHCTIVLNPERWKHYKGFASAGDIIVDARLAEQEQL